MHFIAFHHNIVFHIFSIDNFHCIRIDECVTFIVHCLCRVTVEVCDICSIRIHQTTLSPVSSSTEREVLPSQVGSEAHSEICFCLTQVLVICSTCIRTTVVINHGITIIRTILIFHCFRSRNTEFTDRLAYSHDIIHTTRTCISIFIQTVPQFLHLTVVLGKGSAQSPFPVLSTDRSHVSHDFHTLVLEFTYVLGF